MKSEKFTGFDDVVFNPLGVAELSRLILRLTNTSLTGIFHTAGERPVSKYEFAREVAESLEMSSTQIERGSMESLQTSVKRPNYLALDASRLWKELGFNSPSMSVMLREELKSII